MIFLSNLILHISGWSFTEEQNCPDKCVLVAAPHTSNWDFPMMLLYGFKLKLRYSWVGKHTLFSGYLGAFMKKLGGIPIIRNKKNDYVNALADEIRNKDYCILIIPPEGTRSRAEYWRSGFLHIARTANVPIVLGKLDYKKKSLTFSHSIDASLADNEIMEFAKDFYKDVTPFNPSKFGPVRLKKKD